MKKLVVVLALSFVPAVAFAQQASPTPEQSSSGLSQQDAQVVKDAVEVLRNSFDPTPVPSSSPAASPAVPKKSMAEVADRVVDLGARAIAQAAGTVKKVAPEVWRIMIRQQYAKAAGQLIVPFGMFLISWFCWLKMKVLRDYVSAGKGTSEQRDWAATGGYGAPLLLLFIFGFWFLQSLANTIQYVVNPEFYAFRDLLVLLLNKGQGL